MRSIDAEQGLFAAFGLAEQLTNEVKLPQYAEWEGYNDFLPAHIRRMALSLIHGGQVDDPNETAWGLAIRG